MTTPLPKYWLGAIPLWILAAIWFAAATLSFVDYIYELGKLLTGR